MKKTIVFAGGGTGGHVFPGIAIIQELKKRGLEDIVWIGSNKKIDRSAVNEIGIKFYAIPTGKLRRYFSLQNILDIFKLAAGIITAVILLLKIKPYLVFSKGGYVSVPSVLGAAFLRIPVITHESDFDPGIATKINARFAKIILTSFKETKDFFSQSIASKVIYSGNPVRNEFLTGDPVKGREFVQCPPDKKMILVIGGSQGAANINKAVLKILDKLTASCFVVHQMGDNNFVDLKKSNYFPSPFFYKELPDILKAADVVVSRAGSNALWELAAAGTPSILIPLTSSSSRGDQIRNARLFESKGASLLLEESNLDDKLLETILNLINNDLKLVEMKKNLSELTGFNSSSFIADLILKEERK